MYLCMVRRGFLKKQYPELFYLRELVKKGDYCIDIGANLGYYSTFLSDIVGNEGKICAVEPIPLFGEIWKRNVKRSKINNLELFPFALGKEEQIVKMGIPEKNGVLHHGMTKIASTADDNYIQYFDVQMKNPDIIFGDLPRLNFIKCDVEGYEHVVFSNMQEVIKKHKPIIQSELGGNENRRTVIDILKNLGYSVHLLKDNKLISVGENEISSAAQDFYFLPQ